jgi:osmoprotectant transport system substrate-binding protein
VVAAACGDDDGGGTSSTDGAGGVEFTFVPLDVGGPNTKAALEKGDIDIGLLFSSDGAISKNKWVALEDDKKLQPVDNFVPAIRTDALNDDVESVLNAVSNRLEVKDMQDMVAAVSIDGENPADVAQQYLEDNNLPGDLTATGDITVGSANFAESEIAAELYASALEGAGANVTRKLQFGARDVYIPALESGELDVVPEFVGTLLAFLDPDAEATSDLDATLEKARTAAEAKGFTLLEASPADSVNTFVVTQETADKYDLAKLSDLAGVKDSLKLGGPPECPERPFCILGLENTYGLKFRT